MPICDHNCPRNQPETRGRVALVALGGGAGGGARGAERGYSPLIHFRTLEFRSASDRKCCRRRPAPWPLPWLGQDFLSRVSKDLQSEAGSRWSGPVTWSSSHPGTGVHPLVLAVPLAVLPRRPREAARPDHQAGVCPQVRGRPWRSGRGRRGASSGRWVLSRGSLLRRPWPPVL